MILTACAPQILRTCEIFSYLRAWQSIQREKMTTSTIFPLILHHFLPLSRRDPEPLALFLNGRP